MTEDAKESLTALVVVSLFFGIGYLSLQLLKHIDVPRWVPLAGFVMNTLALAIAIARHWRARRKELDPGSSPTGVRDFCRKGLCTADKSCGFCQN
jgi:protein-S-isoprenylcysteine O-methyltransferase Ste14